jgi:hypothetical protein
MKKALKVAAATFLAAALACFIHNFIRENAIGFKFRDLGGDVKDANPVIERVRIHIKYRVNLYIDISVAAADAANEENCLALLESARILVADRKDDLRKEFKGKENKDNDFEPWLKIRLLSSGKLMYEYVSTYRRYVDPIDNFDVWKLYGPS